MSIARFVSAALSSSLALAAASCVTLATLAPAAHAETTPPPAGVQTETLQAAPAQTIALAVEEKAARQPYRLGVHAEVDLGLMLVMKQSAGLAAGAVWGPFRAGLSYTTFLSNASFGGVPEGFDMRVNYIIGVNASYFIAKRTDEGLYVQAMFHVKQQGVTNKATGDHKDLDSLAAGLELGYLWKIYKGLYVAPRIGALYYFKKPQGADNAPVQIGDRAYDNSRHKDWDTYFIPTLSVGYSW